MYTNKRFYGRETILRHFINQLETPVAIFYD